jgi:hypothetical protein
LDVTDLIQGEPPVPLHFDFIGDGGNDGDDGDGGNNSTDGKLHTADFNNPAAMKLQLGHQLAQEFASGQCGKEACEASALGFGSPHSLLMSAKSFEIMVWCKGQCSSGRRLPVSSDGVVSTRIH